MTTQEWKHREIWFIGERGFCEGRELVFTVQHSTSFRPVPPGSYFGLNYVLKQLSKGMDKLYEE